MHEVMFQAGVIAMSERSELIPCNNIIIHVHVYVSDNNSLYQDTANL